MACVVRALDALGLGFVVYAIICRQANMNGSIDALFAPGMERLTAVAV
jgi:hypothetical protein